MKTIIKYLLGVLLCTFTLSSCEDRLDIAQQGVTDVDAFYKTDEDAMEAIAAVYSTWRGMGYTNFFLKNMLSDDMYAGGGSRGDNTQLEQLNEYTFSSSNTTISDAFSSYYKLIYLSNLVINKFDPAESDTMAQVVAEAKTARAWAYFDLVTLWGPAPLVLTELKPSEYQQANAKVEDIWTQIELDLKEAVSSNALPEKTDSLDKTPGARLTKQAAQSFLGKAQLFQGKYEEAAKTLGEVINSGKYGLYGDYGNILRANADFCCESIFETNSLNDPVNPWSQGNTMFSCMIGWRSDKMFLYGYYWGAHDLYPAGWGFANPTKELYNAFVSMEGINGYRLKNTIKTYTDLLGMGVYLNAGTSLYGNEGYFSWKNRFIGTEVITNSYGFCISSNYRIMRYAEVLLNAAEACLLSNDKTNALKYINKVRGRARLKALADVTLDDIKKEKRLELCSEMVRFQDLIRWGDAATALGSQGLNIPSFYGLNADYTNKVQNDYTNSVYGFKTGKNELLPFPEHEMNVNKNIEQNPGW